MTTVWRFRTRLLLAALVCGCSGDAGGPAAGTEPGASTGDVSTTGTAGSDAGASTTGDSGGECNLWEQDCPNPDEKCSPWSEGLDGTPDENRCCPLAENPKGVGDDCTMTPPYGSCIDDCTRGATCVVESFGLTLSGVCQKLCNPQGDDCEPDQICKVFFESMEDTQEVPLCSDTCDPLVQDCVRANWVCMPEVPVVGGGGGFICVPPPVGDPDPPQAPCTLGNACGVGQVCAPANALPDCAGTGCCTPYCDVSDPNADAACASTWPGTSCVSQGSTAPQWVNVGVCALAP